MLTRLCVLVVLAAPLATAQTATAQTATAQTTRSSRTARPTVPTPESVFGFKAGADSSLFLYDESIEYFRQLAKAQPTRVKLLDVGKTSSGHPWTAVLISSPQNLAKLERYRQINQRLARPEGLTDEQARALAREGRAFVDISGGLHASEIAGSQHTPELAYQLLSKMNEPETKEILDNVIFFLWPSINPDGQDIVVKWCKERFAQTSPLQAPMELYQKYVGHDNNRDSYMLNVIESRVVARTWREWEPQIIYAHHQSSPFPTRMWIPPFADPIGLYAPPIMSRQVNAIGTRIAAELDAKGQPGAVHMLATFDAYYPGYIDYMPMYQNINAWWTETQGGNCGVPRTSTVNDLPTAYKSLMPTSMYSSPWAEGTWSFRDQVDYMVTASVATLRYAARFREELLYNRYQAGRNTIQQYRKGPPYAYIVPQAQRDPMAPVELLRRLAFLGVNVRQLDADATHDTTVYPKGTWVIPMDQEYAQLVRELLEVQKYPELGDDLPYDAAGWTLPMQMHVNVVEAKTPLSDTFRTAMKPVVGKPEPWGASPEYPFTTNATAAGIVAGVGHIAGTGDAIALDPTQNNSFRFINRALRNGGSVRVDTAIDARAARYLVTGIDSARAESWARELSVSAERALVSATAVAAPTRVALYKAAPGIMDQGWTEWLLDTHEFQYTLIGPDVLRAGIWARSSMCSCSRRRASRAPADEAALAEAVVVVVREVVAAAHQLTTAPRLPPLTPSCVAAAPWWPGTRVPPAPSPHSSCPCAMCCKAFRVSSTSPARRSCAPPSMWRTPSWPDAGDGRRDDQHQSRAGADGRLPGQRDRQIRRQRVAPAFRVPQGRPVHAGIRIGRRRAPGQWARGTDGLSAAVARAADRQLSHGLQRAVLRARCGPQQADA